MSLLQAGVDSTVIALWLGHTDVDLTQPYIHADMTIKERMKGADSVAVRRRFGSTRG